MTPAVAVLAVALGSVLTSSAAGGGTASVLVPIAPCRLVDTRPGSDNVGSRSTPVGAGEVFTVSSWGTNGNCTLPSGVTGLSLNVTAVGPSASSFLTVYPADAARPLAASLNWVAGQAPTPNAVTVATSGSGTVSFYNLSGTVDLTVDVVGYYQPSTTGPAGPQGPAGAPGPDPAREIWVAASGGDFTTVSAALASITDAGPTKPYVVRIAPGVYAEPAGITLKDHVDLVGSGVTTTTITSTANQTVYATGTMHGEVRDLTIANTGGGTNTSAVYTKDVTPDGALRFSDVAVSTIGTASTSNWGMIIEGTGEVALADVDVTAISATDTYGIDVVGASPTMTRVSVVAATTSVTNGDVADGIVNRGGATPVLRDVTVSAAAPPGASVFPIGIRNLVSAIVVDGARVTATGSSFYATAVYDDTGASSTYTGLVTASANAGMNVAAGATATVRNSSLIGSVNSADVDGTISITNSSLSQAVFLSGTAHCASSYLTDAVLTPLPSGCA